MMVSNEVICKVSGPTFLRRMSCEIRIKYYTYLYRVKVIFSSMVFFIVAVQFLIREDRFSTMRLDVEIMLMFPSNTARFHTGHCLPSQSLGRKFSLIRQIDIFMNVLLFERSYIRNVQSSFKYSRIAAVLFRYLQ